MYSIERMYVCVCNAVTERQIRALAEQGVRTLDEMSQINGCSSTCGGCMDEAKRILKISQPSRKKINLDVAIANGLSQAIY